MYIAVLPPGDPGVFRPLLLPETARALAAGEPVSALALMEGDLALGVLAGYLEDGIFRITSLYVSPHYRRCGGGRMLDTNSDETYGQFYMKYKDFLKQFHSITRTDLNNAPA